MNRNLTTDSNLLDFIQFFEGIPADRWCVDKFRNNGRHCARGHVIDGCEYGYAVDERLNELAPDVAAINNGWLYGAKIRMSEEERQDGAKIKARVIAYLRERHAREVAP